jgi:hypothetical protein
LAKIIKLFGHREQRVDTHTDDIDGWAPPEQADGPLLSPAEAQKIACDGSSPAAALIRALTTVLTIEPEYIGSWIPVCNRLPDLLEHRDGNVHSLAKQAIIQFAETLAQQRPDALVAWRLKIENLLSLDRRSNRFVNSYPRALATLECLCAVGKWKIQDDDNELVRFCLFLELESHVSTGKFELSDIAGDFIDFCGLSYFRDFYPEANDYMLELLKGDCLPMREQPCRKVFDRLCKFKNHDRISQILIAAVVGGDMGRVDWFTRNLYPHHFADYRAYESSLLELLGSPSMPRDVRENALVAVISIGEDILLQRNYLGQLIDLAVEAFSAEEIETLIVSEQHPKITQMLSSRLRLVR